MALLSRCARGDPSFVMANLDTGVRLKRVIEFIRNQAMFTGAVP
jgi:hypothetical protein